MDNENVPIEYNEETVSKLIQSETDKVRTEYSKKLKVAEEQLATLKPKEKTQIELDLDKKMTELSQREKEFDLKSKKLDFESKLGELGINKGLANYINTDANIDEFLELIKKDNMFIPTKHTPNSGITNNDKTSMSYSDRVNLHNTNPQQYKALFGGK